MSAVKIINFLVNDMLDYALMQSGQFRKDISQFDLKESVQEIIEVLQFKANELGIQVQTEYDL